MPFQYKDYEAPAAGSIAALVMRRGDIAARHAEQIGAIQAASAQQSGQAWAGAAQNIGNAVAAIPQQMQKQKLEALQTQGLQQSVDQGARSAADMKALDQAYLQPGGRDAILKSLPGHLRPIVTKQFTDADEAAAKVQETQLKVTEAQNDYLGGLAANIRDHGYEPGAAQLAISHAKQTYAGNPDMLKQIGQIEAQFQSDPTTIRPIVDQLVGVSAKQKAADAAALTAKSRAQSVQTGSEKFALEAPKIALETQKVGQEVAGTVPMTAAQTAQQARDTERLGLEKQRVGLEGQRVGLERQKVAQGAVPSSPDNPVAKAIAEYRVPPPAARSLASPTGQALMAQVMALNPEYSADQFSRRAPMARAFTSGPQSQAINSLNTAIGHLDQFVDVAKALDNGNFRPGNEAYNWLKATFGDSAPTNFEGIRSIMSGELASAFKKSGATDQEIASVEKAIASKNSTGQLVDYATKIAIPALGSKIATYNSQYSSVMGARDPFKVLTPDAESVLTKYGFDPAHPKMGGAPPGAAAAPVTAPSGMVRVVGPNGETGSMPATSTLPPGWKRQ